MGYDKQILQVLSWAGERGISVLAIAKHVFNMNRTFFVSPDFREIHDYVQQYLLRNSKQPQSLIARTERRGVYRLNLAGSEDARHLMLDFRETKNVLQEETQKPQTDFSLNLFDF